MGTEQVTTGSDYAQSISGASATPSYSRPLAIVTSLFFMWGFLTCLNDILVPHLKSIFDLSYARVMLIQFAFFSAYFLFSVPWSRFVNAIGYKTTMVIGLLTMAIGAFLFLPAASVVSYPLFLTALLVLAAGITGLQVSANPYVVLLGKPKTASSRLDLTQAFNSLGTTIAPKFGGLLILSSAPLAIEQLHTLSPQALHVYRIQQAASVKMPYTVIGVALLLLAVLIGASKLPKIETGTSRARKQSKGFDLETSQSDLRRDWDFRLRRCRGLHRQLSGELLWLARDCGSLRQDCSRFCLVLLGWRYDRAVCWRRTSAAFQARLPACS